MTLLSANQPVRIPGYRHIQDADRLNCLRGAGNYTTIELRGHPRILMVTQTLKYFEDQLPDFVRVSKSLLLNPAFVSRIEHVSARTLDLHLNDSTTVSVPRRRISRVLSRLERHLPSLRSRA